MSEAGRFDLVAVRALDIIVSFTVLLILMPFLACLALAIKLESTGPLFYRCRRVGYRGTELEMLKFRKMRLGVDGPALTRTDDDRFTRLGHFLAHSKLDEVPQLWNVLCGHMSLVGPRPEDERFVRLHSDPYRKILSVKPGVTGYCQLAFAKESEILDGDDVQTDYVVRLLPQKVQLDLLYAAHRSLRTNLRVMAWTALAIVTRRDVAVNRETGALTVRRRPVEENALRPETAEAA
jgi:lipopolysaccharide/colanic/teichoic acid biosynthesis glycosyltransferase